MNRNEKDTHETDAPRIMIAAPASGSGKTLITCGLLRLLQKRFSRIQSFKCGPDYIDPLFHRQVLGLPSVNLDTYFTGSSLTRALFTSHAEHADISVIEGVMGYFDGAGGVLSAGSSCELAAVTQTPVVLVVNAQGMSRSVIALIKGFCDYDSERLIQGVILNRVSKMLYLRLRELIERELKVKVLGYLPVCNEYVWESRHLGLLLPQEIATLQEQISGVAALMEETVDVPALIELARSAKKLPVMSPLTQTGIVREMQCPVRIAVAQDESFCFYYEDNLSLLHALGAQIIFFSPLHDSQLPDSDGLLLGGGYPELHAAELSANVSMRENICRAVNDGMPVIAECGGFMYLQQSLKDKNGNAYPMTGALSGESSFTGHLVRFGYASFTGRAFDMQETITVRGHEFHYFDSTDNGSGFEAHKPAGGKSWKCMVQGNTVLAGFPHLYYYSQPELARAYIAQCRRYAARNLKEL